MSMRITTCNAASDVRKYAAPDMDFLPLAAENPFLDASGLVEGIDDDPDLYTWE